MTIEIEATKQFDRLANFRDIGGFKTQYGQTMKSGLIFRSDDLSQLSSNDLDKLEQLNLKLICDLRTPNERKSKVDRIPQNKNIRIVNIPIYHQSQDLTRLDFFLFLITTARKLDFAIDMQEFYHRMAFERTNQINEIMTLLSDERNLPALIHCTGGKDRTGYVSALIQLLTGVPYETVMEDYLTSNRFTEPRMKKVLRYIRWMSLFQVSPRRIQPMLEVRREYLEEVLNDVFKEYGTIKDYLNKACSVDPKSLTNLQQLLLE